MLSADEILKIATEIELPVENTQEDDRSPIRKVYDTVAHGAQTAGGALVAGVAGLNSLDQKSPMKTI